jgi:hypothetical protein
MLDFDFNIDVYPICKSLLRVHSVDMKFNCTLNTPENIEKQDIWLDYVEPSLVINMPTEEFYEKVNPQIGFSYIIGTMLGAKLNEAM